MAGMLARRMAGAGQMQLSRRLMSSLPKDIQAEGFFNRKQELEWLQELLRPSRASVSDLIVVNGPKDSGKSALISEYVRRQKQNEYPGVSFKVDLRQAPAISPQGIASLLKSSIFDFFGFDTASVKLGMAAAEITSAFEKLKPEKDMAPLLSAIRSYGLTWKTCWKKGGHGYENAFPTLIIDEANLLRGWTLTPESQEELRRLVEFLVMVSKQEGLMNVVLLSSENFFQSWIEKMIGSHRCTPVTVGDLTEDESRVFFTTLLNGDGKHLLTDELWSDIFSVVGGRIFLLARAANHLPRWEMLKRTLLSSATLELKRALDLTSFSPGSYTKLVAPAWTSGQWRDAMKVVVEHEDGVTPYSKLSDQLTARVVDSFIEHDLLSYRSDTGWSRDFSRPAADFPLVMPASRVYYRAMKDLVKL